MKTQHVTARLVRRGMGGSLNPPTHPEHDWSVETDLRRKPENRGGASLTAATEADWLDPAVRAEACGLLERWQPLPPAHPDVVAWRQQVLGYFRSCYRNPGVPAAEQWHAANVVIDGARDPLEHAADHAGVRHIREFYPDFAPTAEDFRAARWGGES